MNTRKIFVIILFCLLCFTLHEHGKSEKKEIIVYAAASLTETLTEIKAIYESNHEDINIIYNFDSSGTLKTQIEMGAECDIFLSASTKQMNQLKELNLVEEDTEVLLLENKIALVVPNDNPKKINSFRQMADLLIKKDIFMAIGNSDVPVGQYSLNLFNYFNIKEENVSSCLTYGSNVKEVSTHVKESMVDCGIVYTTEAYSADLKIVDIATLEMTQGRVVYPVAILKNTKNKKVSEEFIYFLQSEKALEVFRSVGFATIN